MRLQILGRAVFDQVGQLAQKFLRARTHALSREPKCEGFLKLIKDQHRSDGGAVGSNKLQIGAVKIRPQSLVRLYRHPFGKPRFRQSLLQSSQHLRSRRDSRTRIIKSNTYRQEVVPAQEGKQPRLQEGSLAQSRLSEQ